jgi:hypothetical protein
LASVGKDPVDVVRPIAVARRRSYDAAATALQVISFQLFAAKNLAAFLAATGCDRTPQNGTAPVTNEA